MATTIEKKHFVKYKNRKIHGVGENSPYVTMEELLEIVASGVPIEVRDDQTSEDITAYVLTRLIFDRARMDKDAFSVQSLQKLIMTNPPPPRKKDDKAA